MKLNIKQIKNKKNISTILVITLISLILGTTYAAFEYIFLGTGKNIIKSDNISIEFLESTDTINMTNAFPIPDDNGKTQTDTFDFAVTTKTNSDNSIKYKLTIEKLEVDTGYTAFNDNEVKVYLTDYDNNELVEPTLISNLGSTLYQKTNTHSRTNTEIQDKYKLRVWIDYNVDSSEWDENINFQYKFKIGVKTHNNLDNSDANIPKLSSNMIPVYYDENCKFDTGCWRKADYTNANQKYKWYDYDSKIWANVVTVNSSNRSKYLSANLGTEINMNDINTMLVWIPRYKYKVWNYNLDGESTSNPQEIQITFEKGTASTGEITCTDNVSGTDGSVSQVCKINNTNCTNDLCNDKYYTHPAFTFGEKETEGIWVSKFEISSLEKCDVYEDVSAGCFCNNPTITPLVKPNVASWRGAMIGTFDYAIRGMNDTGNIYGFAKTDDTHVVKNIEWGAIAYLSHSKYGTCDNGVCKTLSFNNSSDYITGVSSGSVPSETWFEEFPNYRYDETKKYNYSIVEGTGSVINSTVENDSDYPWSNTNGVYKSTNQYEGGTSTSLKFNFSAPNNETYLTFDWSVSSEGQNYDYLYYTIIKDGEILNETGIITKIGGLNLGYEDKTMQYLNVVKKLDAGNYELIFTYTKNEYSSDGSDSGYVKNVKIINSAKVNIETTIIGDGKDGPSASTTGNIYGIYDISGGSVEYVMSRIVGSDGQNLLSGYNDKEYSGYSGILYDDERYTSYTGVYSNPNYKYYDKYSFNTDAFNEAFNKLGDATKEVLGQSGYRWYNNFYNNIQYNYPFQNRGNWYQSGSESGIYEAGYNSGSAASSISTHLVVIPNSAIMPDNTDIDFGSLVCEAPEIEEIA